MKTQTEIVKVNIQGKGYSKFETEKRTTVILSNGEHISLGECLRVIGNEGFCEWREIENIKKRVLSSKIKFIAKYENQLIEYTKSYIN